VIIKVCGITWLEDALVALECGANALGFNFYPPSPRCVSLRTAERIISRLPPEVLTVAVCVHPQQAGDFPCTALQVHGAAGETDLPSGSGKRVFAAVDIDQIDRFPSSEIVIDPSWGTGRKADWRRLQSVSRPYVLSGGLTPENVGSALTLLQPAGVDVCSGVESSPGIKDHQKIKSFMEEVFRATSRPDSAG
jgi:phosphoribosylanthranilate isomerase